MSLNSIPEIIEDIRQGRMVVILDDEDRENEGDLVMAAECARAEDINFMAKHGRGLVCLPMSKDRCERLQLPLMASRNESKHGTAFTVSIEAAQGITTGISAADRATTIQAAASKTANPSDIVQPGHVFPLVAQPGGVLRRAGHTEAACDLARMAGFEEAAVIVEILNEDGTMARREDLESFAHEHNLKIGTVADLIEYRLTHERSVMQVSERTLNTDFGEFQMYGFRDELEGGLHIALVHGQVNPDEAVPVRVHLERTVPDLLGEVVDAPRWTVRNVQEYLKSQPCGILVLLREPEPEGVLVEALGKPFSPPVQPKEAPTRNMDLRQYGLGAQILLTLGVRKMRVLSSPIRMHAISGFGLEVVDYVAADGIVRPVGK